MSTRIFHRLRTRWSSRCAGIVLVLASVCVPGAAFAGPTFEAAKPVPLYSYFATGDVQAAVTAPSSRPTPSFVLMGGGPDVDPAFRWLIQRAGIRPGTGGRFVILRASGEAGRWSHARWRLKLSTLRRKPG